MLGGGWVIGGGGGKWVNGWWEKWVNENEKIGEWVVKKVNWNKTNG